MGAIEERTNLIISQAPIIPPYSHPGDTSNFEKYAETFDGLSDTGNDPYKDLFVDFS
jgi:hypothetical protein